MNYVKSISVKPLGITMDIGDSRCFSASVSPSNATNKCVTWVSSDSWVATVNPDSGLVYARHEGTARIYAVADDGSNCSGYSTVTVKDIIYVNQIILDEPSHILNRGHFYSLNATVLPSNATNRKIRWSSSNKEVATVSENSGLIFAKSAGVATISAIAKDGSGVKGSCTISVLENIVDYPQEEEPEITVPESIFGDPVDIYSGAHLIDNTVMSLFGGQGLKLIARYNSVQLCRGLLGYGWYYNFEKYICVDGDELLVHSNPSIFSRYIADNNSSTRFICCSPIKNGYVLTVDYSNQYPYVIDCNSARTEYYNANGNIAKIKDHQGFETTITYSDNLITITDTVSGKKIYLEKDSTPKVVRVYDDAGREAFFTYTNNTITSITDVNGNALTYEYDNKNRVISGTDAKGVRYFENTYDDYGRVSTQVDALNHTSHFDYGEDVYETIKGDTRIVIDRNGKVSRRVYDCNGLLIKYTDGNGNTKIYEYDDHCNIIKETDANGNSIIKTYNKFNKPTQITDRTGKNTIHLIYDNVGNLTEICYPAINGGVPKETFVYNNRNQLTQHTDIRETTTTYTYDINGMPATKKVGNKNAVVYSYENGLLKSQTDSLNHTTRYTYNVFGQVSSKTDANNQTTQYAYDKIGNLIVATDANGKTIANTYDENYQKTSVTEANGNKTEYIYNGNMKNNEIVLPDGHTICYEFDNEDRVTQIIDQQNNVTEIVYDDVGNIVSKKFSDGAIVQYEYDNMGNVLKEINPKGGVVSKTYDELGNMVTVTDDDGNLTSYEYNAMSEVVKITNAMAGTTVYEYSKAGDLLSETDAIGNKKRYTYDAYGNRLTATDANNNVTAYTYDQNNNLLTVTDALGNVTTYEYNALNQCVSVKDALNNKIQYEYDALGRKTAIIDARGNKFTTIYDGNGNVIKTLDAKGNTINETVYDSFNKPVTITDSMGKTTTYTYNALGKIESITDSSSHRTEFAYNSRGQKIKVCDAANNASFAYYDLLGNVTCLSGPLGGSTNYTYDNMGRLVEESTTSGGTKKYEYNQLNVKKKITNARGQVKQIFHDAIGRITGYTSPEGAVSYTYDANGNVLTIIDSHGTITRTYDALNRVSSYTDTYGKVVRYEYDAVGNLSKIIYPDNTAVTYAYDANHNLIRVTDWANRVTSYTYDVNNRVVGVTKPDGSVTTTVYDSKQRVTSTVERTSSGVVITGFEYAYDNLSRIIEEKVLANSTKMCYTYDDLDRVTSRIVKNVNDESIISTETFNYDAASNIISTPDSSFQYDTNNRLTLFNDNSVSYDMDGNMLSNGVLSCTYDSANRLITASGHTYTYDAENTRIRNLCSDADTAYTYDTNCNLSRLLQKTTNEHTTKYVYGIGLIGEEKHDCFKTYHFDSRGSTIAITDVSGNITDTFAYDTYGNTISHIGESFVIFGYNGRDGVVTDKNGLIYMRTRYYSPLMMRFINADIIPGNISNSITLNRFAYANGNPVSLIDPFGLCAKEAEMTQTEIEYFSKVLGELISLSEKNDKLNFETYIGSTKYYQTVELKFGHGMDIEKILKGQLELSQSLEFLPEEFDKTVGTDGSVEYKYSVDVDEYNSISVSAKFDLGKGTVGFEYQIDTKLKNETSISTTMGIETQIQNPPKNTAIKDPVLVPANSYAFENRSTGALALGGLFVWDWLLRGLPVVKPSGGYVSNREQLGVGFSDRGISGVGFSGNRDSFQNIYSQNAAWMAIITCLLPALALV